jgi:hypothetical protein
MAKLFKVNGTIETVEPENKTDFQLAELQKIVGGLIEVVPVFGDKYIVVDEEGRMKNYKHNVKASILTHGEVNGDIVGDMLLCKRSEIK